MTASPGTLPAPDRLSIDEVHLVRFQCLAVDTVCIGLLDEGERARAARLTSPRARRIFIHAHAIARIVLGRAVDRSPGSLRFQFGASGKPELSPELRGVQFNLTHAPETSVCSRLPSIAMSVWTSRRKSSSTP